MKQRPWTREELILAMNLYCQLPFGKMHRGNREIVALAQAINRTPSSVAMKLCNLASLDPDHQERGVRGLSKASAADRRIWDEFHADWNRLAAESESLRDRMVAARASDSAGDTSTMDGPPPTGEYVGESETVRTQKVRLAQRFFRKAVVAAYHHRCCVSQISVRSLLVASHIAPWASHPDSRANPRNGLCLSRLHDAAFDRGLITFDEEYRLVLANELRDATTNQVLETAFTAFESKPIQLPEKFLPEPSFLAVHRQSIFRG